MHLYMESVQVQSINIEYKFKIMKILNISDFIDESAGAPLKMRTPDRYEGDPLRLKKPGEILRQHTTKQRELLQKKYDETMHEIRESIKRYIKKPKYKGVFDLKFYDKINMEFDTPVEDNVVIGDGTSFVDNDCALFLGISPICCTHKTFKSIPEDLKKWEDEATDAQERALFNYGFRTASVPDHIWYGGPMWNDNKPYVPFIFDDSSKNVLLYKKIVSDFPYRSKFISYADYADGLSCGTDNLDMFAKEDGKRYEDYQIYFKCNIGKDCPVYGTIGIIDTDMTYTCFMLDVCGDNSVIVENKDEIIKSFKTFIDTIYNTINSIFERVFA